MPAADPQPVDLGRRLAPAPSVPSLPLAPRWGRAAWTALRGFVAVLWADPLTFAGFVLVAMISFIALLVWVVPLASQSLVGHAVSVLPYDPNQLFVAPSDQAPSAAHLFGTDDLGRDTLSRVFSALPVDLGIGLGITASAVLFGGALGVIAGFWDKPGTLGGIVSVVILRVTDIFLAFPSLVLALAIAASLGRTAADATFAIAVSWWPFYVRLVRGEVLAVKTAPYIVAARAGGLSDVRILFRHVFRNILEPVVIYYTLDVGSVIITFSTLAYVGFRFPILVSEWGTLINHYQSFVTTDPWPTLAVGAMVFVTVLAFSLLGDGLRDALDPRSRRAMTVGSSVAEAAAAPAAPQV